MHDRDTHGWLRGSIRIGAACGLAYLAWLALATLLPSNLAIAESDNLSQPPGILHHTQQFSSTTGPDLAVTGIQLVSGASQEATVIVTVTNVGVSDTLGPDGTGWFGTDLYVKPIGSPPPVGPGDRYLGACPTITNYCPSDIRWNLYRIIQYVDGPGLAPSESQVLTFTYSFTAPGEYWLYSQADVFWGENGDPDVISMTFGSSQNGRIVEEDETNNISGPYTATIRSQVLLPLVGRHHDSTRPLFAIQMYGAITASTGFTRLVEAGATWIRFPIYWVNVEPVNTTPDNYFWAAVDNSVQTIVDANVEIIATIEHNPSWASARLDGPVTNTADLLEFVGALAARYPQIDYWEIYNEPDSINRFGLNSAGYAQMLKSVYPVIKAANPSAHVVLGGLAMDWYVEEGGPFDSQFLTNVLSACVGSPCLDVVNFHYYPAFRHKWESYGHDIIGKAVRVRQILTSYGYSLPIINTEMGWPAGTIWGSPSLAARYVTKSYVRALAAGLPVANWFALVDADASNPGLLGPGYMPRPAHSAYRVMASLLQQPRFVRAIPSTETGSARLEGYQLSVLGNNGYKRVDVYWYDCPSMYMTSLYQNGAPVDCADRAPLRVAASQVTMVTHLGTATMLTDAGDGILDGWVTIPNGGVDTNPIYVDFGP